MSEGDRITPDPNHTPTYNRTLLAAGVCIVVLGCLFALGRTGLFDMEVFRLYWPTILVFVGIVRLSKRGFNETGGWVLVALGALLFVHTLSEHSLIELIWPAIMVLLGIFLVKHAVSGDRREAQEHRGSERFLRGTAILSGFKHRPNGGSFDGGAITAVFGSFEIDLRRVVMQAERTRIDINVLFAGGEIRVPDGWDVYIQASAIAGAVEDKTIHPPVQGWEDQRRPKLLITGSVLFGGVEVK